MAGWIGVDLDGTLAHYHGWKGVDHIGEPIPAMVERVKAWLAEGQDVRIFTARVAGLWPIGGGSGMVDTLAQAEANMALTAIQAWSQKHLGDVLPVTALKDFGMIELWDDRAVQVNRNTGFRADGLPE